MYKLENGEELTQQDREAFKKGLTRAYIKYGTTIMDQSNFLMNAQYRDEKADPENGQFIGVTSMRELKIKLNNLENALDLENKDIEYHLGAKVGNEYKYINFGNFIVQKPNNEEVNEETTFTALDYMCKFDIDEPYVPEVVFPTTLAGLAEDVCRQVEVELGNTDFRNADMPILANPFLNGENPRTVLKSIAKLSFSCAYIGQDNKLYFGFDWYEDELFTINNVKGTNFTTNVEKSLKIDFRGNSEQDSTISKNLYNFKDTSSVTSGIIVDDNGWITATYDNTSGSATRFMDYFTHNLDLQPNTNYNIVAEVKSVTGTGRLIFVSYQTQGNQGQFVRNREAEFNTLNNNTTYCIIEKTKANWEGDVGIRTYVRYGAGESGSITFRLSVLKDTSITPQTFVYEKYGGNNLCPPLIYGIRPNPTTGVEEVNTTSATTDYIPVDFTLNPNYYLSGLTSRLQSFVAAYNSSKQFLGRTGGAGRTDIGLSSNVFTGGTSQGTGAIAYIRVTQYVVSNLPGVINEISDVKLMLNIGNTPLSYEPYTQGYAAPTASWELPIRNFTGHNEIKVVGDNLFDRENASENTALKWVDGQNNGETKSIASDFINVKGINHIISNYMFAIFYYDKYKTYLGNSSDLRKISGVYYSSVDIVQRDDIRYIRLGFRTGPNGNVDMNEQDIMVNIGETLLDYVEYQSQTLPLDLSCKNICTGASKVSNIYLSFEFDEYKITNNCVISFITDVATANNSIYLFRNGTQTDRVGRVTGNANQRASGILTLTDEQLREIRTSSDTYTLRAYKENANWTKVEQAQIENGYALTDYMPYEDYSYEFNKIKDFQDNIYRQGDKWYKKEYIPKYTFTGSETFSTQTGIGDTPTRMMFACSGSIIDIFPVGMSDRKGLCNYFDCYNMENDTYTVQAARVNATAFNFNRSPQYSNFIYFKLEKSLLPEQSEAGMKQWVKNLYDIGKPLVVYGQLETPNIIEITSQTLISQLNAIEQTLHSYEGNNLVFTLYNDNNAQAYLDVTYTKRQFPTADENLTETITVDGYFENKPNNQVKPISAITLRSSEVKAAGQTIYDDDLIEQYGVNELIVEEDYIAYTDTLRNAFLEGARGLFGLTYKPLDIDLLGSVYLSFNDGIKVINPQGETYRTFALNNTHEYNGTLYNSISIPALSEVEEKYLYETEDKTLRRKTAIEIDKANQQIQSIVSEIGDRSEKQTTITQDIDSIELKISDIEDLTVEKVGNNPLTLDNCLEGNLLQFKIKGNNTVFSGLEPSNSLVPSDTLVPQGDSILKVYTNNKCFTENGKWLPQGRNLNETMTIRTTWYLGAGYHNITNEIYYKLYKYTESYRIGYIRCEKGHTYSINMPKTYGGSFACAVFDETLLEKMDTQMDITPLVAYGNASYNNGSFSYNNNIKNYDFIVEQDGYIVIYIPNASLYDIEIYDRSTTDVFSIVSDLMKVDNDYSMYFSIKGNPSFVLTNIYYYDSNKTLLGNYYTYYSRDIKNGLNNTEIILPKNTKYISLEIKKKDSNDNFVNIGDFDIKNIKPMLEYVAKYKNNSTYSGTLANWVAELNAIYNYNYYYIGNQQLLKATNTTEFEFEYTEFENDREESAILGTGNNTDFVFYTKTDGLTEEYPYKKKMFVYNSTEYAINTQNDFLNVRTKVSFKKDTNTGNYTLKLEDEENHIEEFTIPATTSFESEGYLGFFSNKSTATTANLKIFNIKCWNNEDLVLDFVPALNKNNSRVGLYNTVANTATTWQDYSGPGSAGLTYFVAPESEYENYNNQILDLGITEPLRQLNSEVYDELIYDYEEELYNWKIIRRVGVTAGGELYELTNEVIEYLELPLISLAEGVNYIDIGKPYIANCYAKYVQINEFTKEFATTYQVESMITQLANSITLLVREKVNKEEVIAELNLEISQGKGIVRITGNQVIIDSDYFHLTADGQITATEGYIAGFRMWQDTQNGEIRSWLTKDFVYNGDDYRSGLLVKDDYNSDFLFAGMPLVSGWNTSDAATRILHNGTMYVKRINFNSESGYVKYLFDSGRTAFEIDRNQMIFRVDDAQNTMFAAFLQGLYNMQVNLIGAHGFSIYDQLHSRTLYHVNGEEGNIPNHYFVGVMWVDRDLDGNYIRVAQDGDWLSDERLKKDIKDSKTNALEIIDKLSFKQFTWNEETRKSGTHINIGLIAQDVEKIDENFVYVTPRIKNDKQEDLLSIDILNLLTTTTKAVQELNDIVKKQQEEIDSLKKEIEKLKGEK